MPPSPSLRFGDLDYLEFESLTYCPIQTKMVKAELLSADELAFLNAYHAKCFELVSPLVEGAALEWLKENTQPLGQ